MQMAPSPSHVAGWGHGSAQHLNSPPRSWVGAPGRAVRNVSSDDEASEEPRVPSVARRVLVVEDHPITRMALGALIRAEPDLTICGEAGTVADAVALLSEGPDIVLVDLRLGPDDGLELLVTMQTRCPEVPALVVSSCDPGLFAERALSAGAVAFLPKHEVATRLVDTIRRTLADHRDGR